MLSLTWGYEQKYSRKDWVGLGFESLLQFITIALTTGAG
jgi:hypothetical protein